MKQHSALLPSYKPGSCCSTDDFYEVDTSTFTKWEYTRLIFLWFFFLLNRFSKFVYLVAHDQISSEYSTECVFHISFTHWWKPIASTSWLLWLTLVGSGEGGYVLKTPLAITWDMYPEVEVRGHFMGLRQCFPLSILVSHPFKRELYNFWCQQSRVDLWSFESLLTSTFWPD